VTQATKKGAWRKNRTKTFQTHNPNERLGRRQKFPTVKYQATEVPNLLMIPSVLATISGNVLIVQQMYVSLKFKHPFPGITVASILSPDSQWTEDNPKYWDVEMAQIQEGVVHGLPESLIAPNVNARKLSIAVEDMMDHVIHKSYK
jgi:hypothetical protein